ncbi:DUF6541 family protein [Pseudonocardia hispaniensis]|uniref:DUF6541 family protein n=1 Tax=Pseudonocardia hispaniensis TaxID=904933 RepID=A0ABW1J5Z9_9PSEU
MVSAQLAHAAWVVFVYLGILWVPGLALAHALGARGWTLIGSAPLVTYGVAGFLGPLAALAGVPWSAATYLAVTAVLVLAAVGTRLRRSRAPGSALVAWSTAAHLGVAGVLTVAAAVGGAVIARAMSDLNAVPQDWDAVFHANGIRYLSDTGDSSLYGMSTVNWFEPGTAVFYPNAYHLLGAVVYQLTGASIPAVLNAHTLLIPGLTALALVVLIRRFGGRAVLAGGTAIVVVSLSALYDMLWRGPLLPYATAVALTPLVVVLLRDLVDATGVGDRVRCGGLVAVGLAGLICLQPASLFGAVLFALPAFGQRWWSRPRLVVSDVPLVILAGIAAAVLTVLQLTAGLGSAGDLDAMDWPADLGPKQALGEFLTFSHGAASPQVWIVVAVLAGLLTYRRLGDLRWIGVVAAAFGMLFLIAASSDAPWANSITRFWWNDRWRLIAPAAIALALIAGNGLAETQRWSVAAAGRLRRRDRAGPSRRFVTAGRATVAISVLAAFAVLTGGLYLNRNTTRMAVSFAPGPALTPDEVVGLHVLAEMAGPGARVLNDRGDGTAWMYALTGLHPVAGHYNAANVGPEATLLAERFNQYPRDPAVRAVVGRLGIHYVILSRSFLRPWAHRQPGLVGLDDASWLERVYQNSDVVIFRITPDAAAGSSGD